MSCIELCIPSNVFSPYTPADKVAITGDFDNWEHSEFVLVYDGRAENYKVTIPGVSAENIAFKVCSFSYILCLIARCALVFYTDVPSITVCYQR